MKYSHCLFRRLSACYLLMPLMFLLLKSWCVQLNLYADNTISDHENWLLVYVAVLKSAVLWKKICPSLEGWRNLSFKGEQTEILSDSLCLVIYATELFWVELFLVKSDLFLGKKFSILSSLCAMFWLDKWSGEEQFYSKADWV